MRLKEIQENYIAKLRTDALNLLVRLVAKGDNEINTDSMSDELNKMGHSVNANSLADLVKVPSGSSFLVFTSSLQFSASSNSSSSYSNMIFLLWPDNVQNNSLANNQISITDQYQKRLMYTAITRAKNKLNLFLT